MSAISRNSEMLGGTEHDSQADITMGALTTNKTNDHDNLVAIHIDPI